ncbi:MAG: protein kinase [Holophagales bacterium]|nr:protein kinase [Holophagales bacterium]
MLAKVGKYEIIEKVGVGGFGTVYRGRDPYIKRTVAIKTCQSDEDELRKRFFREAEFAGNLHHRNITTIYDFGLTDEGLPYIVQEFLTGEDLDRKIKRKDDLPLAWRVRVLADICDGLHYAHTSGIVHRDVKPSNIRILEDGTVKIMDFGIAKSMVTESTLTQTGITLGTASYLAPEQIRGEPVDARTDIFSLGVLAYELFTYTRPFTGDHISTVLYKIMNERPPSPAEVVAGLPPELVAVIEKTLEKDRNNRFASCADLKTSLMAVLEVLSGPVVAPPPRSTTPPVRPVSGEEALPAGQRTFGSARLDERQLVEPKKPAALAERPLRPSPPSEATSGSLAPRPEETGSALKVFLGALAILLVVGGGLGWLLLGPGAKNLDPAPRTAEPAATAAPAETPLPEPTVPATPLPGKAIPTVLPTAVTTAGPTAVPVVARTAVATGTALVSSNAYAQVSIDGAPRGGVFKPKGFPLPPGRHVASFESGGYGPIKVPFEVTAGGTVPVRADFPPLGQLWISVNPDAVGAEILVDGVLVGKAGSAPLKKTVAAGNRRVEARLQGFETAGQSVEVYEQDKADVLLALRRKLGSAP